VVISAEKTKMILHIHRSVMLFTVLKPFHVVFPSSVMSNEKGQKPKQLES